MEKKINLKIGQDFKFKKEMEVEKLFGNKEIINKGSIAVVGADKLLHHKNGIRQPISEESFDIQGYDVTGIAKWIWKHIKYSTPIDEEVLEDYDIDEIEFISEIEYALTELGF